MAEWSTLFSGVSAGATLMAAGRVGFAGYQVRQTKAQARVDFLESVVKQALPNV